MPDIAPDEVVEVLTSKLFIERLNDTQGLVLRESLQGKSYQQIAETFKYDTDYIKGVGSRLWRSLSRRLGTVVTKSNLRSVISTYVHQFKLLCNESKALSNPLSSPDNSYYDKSKIVAHLECETSKPDLQSYPFKLTLNPSFDDGKTLCQGAVDKAVTLKEPPIQPPKFDHQTLIDRLRFEKKVLTAQIKEQSRKLGVKSAMILTYKEFQRIEYLNKTQVRIDATTCAEIWRWLAARQPELQLQLENDELTELVPLHDQNKAIFVEGWIEGVLTVWYQVKDEVDYVDVE